jgi:translation initiation factor 2 beta subunit (eIF-2beta)/eIF-5
MKITKQQLRQIIKEEILQERNDEKVMQLLAAAVGTARDQLKKSNRLPGDLKQSDVQSVLDQYKESFNKNIKDKTIKAEKLKDIEAAKEHVSKKGIPGNL